jgi:hypothetical protein
MTEQEVSKQEVPEEAQEQVRKAIGDAVDQPQRAQGFLSNIPDLSATGGVKDKIASVLTAVLGAIDTLQQYSWILPQKYVEPIQKVEDALRKVQGWLD